jgi:hypothetical protein
MIKPRRMRWAGHVKCWERCACIIWLENLKGGNHSENLGIDVEIILYGDWMHLAQDRDQWQAPVYTLMNLQVL